MNSKHKLQLAMLYKFAAAADPADLQAMVEAARLSGGNTGATLGTGIGGVTGMLLPALLRSPTSLIERLLMGTVGAASGGIFGNQIGSHIGAGVGRDIYDKMHTQK